jgi:hypothetical protein
MEKEIIAAVTQTLAAGFARIVPTAMVLERMA